MASPFDSSAGINAKCAALRRMTSTFARLCVPVELYAGALDGSPRPTQCRVSPHSVLHDPCDVSIERPLQRIQRR